MLTVGHQFVIVTQDHHIAFPIAMLGVAEEYAVSFWLLKGCAFLYHVIHNFWL